MPAIKKRARTADFEIALSNSAEMGETKDCAVRAVSIATGVPYPEVHAYMEQKGRKDRRGTTDGVINSTLTHFGFKVAYVNYSSLMELRPKGHREVLKNLTTHHPDRFPGVFDPKKTYLLYARHHVLCVKGGVNHDWTRGKSRRVLSVYEVIKAAS